MSSGQHPPESLTRAKSLRALLQLWWPLLLGNVLEWYEFGVYGFLSPEMSNNFFDGSSVATWLGFSVTFLMRPVGGFVFGWFADRFGRRVACLVTMFGMLVATVGQGLVPTASCCGEGARTPGLVILLCLRVLQGVSVGGEIGPIVAYFAESAPHGRAALGTSFFLSSAVFAFVLASAAVQVELAIIGNDGMMSWGWRLPYLVAFVPGIITIWGRSKLPETPEFLMMKQAQAQEERDAAAAAEARETDASEDALPPGKRAAALVAGAALVNRAGVGQVLRHHALSVLVGFGSSVGGCSAFYSSIWATAHQAKRGLSQGQALWLSTVTMPVILVASIVLPWATDRWFDSDSRPLHTFGAVFVTLFAFPVFALLDAFPGDFWVAFVALAIVFGLAAGFGLTQAYHFCAELFPTNVRALGFGLTFNLAMSYIGGTSSLVESALDLEWHVAPGAYISALGLVSTAALLWCRRLRAQGRLPRYAPTGAEAIATVVEQAAGAQNEPAEHAGMRVDV